MSGPVLDPDLLKAFVAVADHHSFTRAAVTLSRTQSAVSMQIKRLEDRLGVELFSRTKANVDLSAAGEGLLGYAKRILALNEEAVGRLAERKVEGVVRLGVMDDYGTSVVPPLLASFLACYPHSCRDGDGSHGFDASSAWRYLRPRHRHASGRPRRR